MKPQLILAYIFLHAIAWVDDASASGCPHLRLPSEGTSFDRRDPGEEERMTAALKADLPEVMDLISYAGDGTASFKLAMKEVNDISRATHLRFGATVGRHVTPLVVLNDYDRDEQGEGSTITYFAKNGEIRRYKRTSDDYVMYKGLSHLVMGVFSHVAPYFKTPSATGWMESLREFQVKLRFALRALDGAADLANRHIHQRATEMLTKTDEFITKLLDRAQGPSLAEFQEFGADMFPLCEENIRQAVRLQTKALAGVLSDLKAELGTRGWEETYFVIPTVHSVSDINTRSQVLETLCSRQHLATHLVMLENVESVDQAREMMGRVLSDRALGWATFGAGSGGQGIKEFYSLSVTQDLLSEFANDEIKKLTEDED